MACESPARKVDLNRGVVQVALASGSRLELLRGVNAREMGEELDPRIGICAFIGTDGEPPTTLSLPMSPLPSRECVE